MLLQIDHILIRWPTKYHKGQFPFSLACDQSYRIDDASKPAEPPDDYGPAVELIQKIQTKEASEFLVAKNSTGHSRN